jgi:hypothetical protein
MTKLPKVKFIHELTRKEFIAFTKEVSHLNGKVESEDDAWVRKFDELVPHPLKRDLIFWPPEGVETPEDIVNEIEKYCKENDLPCFKA